MTEQEWYLCEDPITLLDFLHSEGKGNDRKLRLFAVACYRGVWELVEDPRSRQAVETAERYADGAATNAELLDAAHEANEAASPITQPTLSVVRGALNVAHLTTYAPHTLDTFLNPPERTRPAYGGYAREAFFTPQAYACLAVIFAADCAAGASVARNQAANREAATDTEFQARAALVREIFGDPFQPVAVDSAWLTSDVLLLARGIYDEKAFDRLPILADALQDAGCDEDEFLSHLRHGTGHVRGCWALDLILRT